MVEKRGTGPASPDMVGGTPARRLHLYFCVKVWYYVCAHGMSRHHLTGKTQGTIACGNGSSNLPGARAAPNAALLFAGHNIDKSFIYIYN